MGQRQSSHTIFTRSTALAFIYLVIVGNIWFIMSFSVKTSPRWLQILFSIGVLWVISSGVAMLVHSWLLRPNADVLEEDCHDKIDIRSGKPDSDRDS